MPSTTEKTTSGSSLPQTPVAPVPDKVATSSDRAQEGVVVYQSRGRRDPFQPPQKQQHPIEHLKITGIMRGTQSFYALVESDSSPGRGYIIREGDVVESARVVEITEDSVVFSVPIKSSNGKSITRTVKKQICCR